MATKTPKPLGLRIKRHWLEEIVAGRKKIEYRDLTPHYIARFAPESKDYLMRDDIKALRLYVSSKEYAIVELKLIDLDDKQSMFCLHLGKIIEDKSKERL
jgi:hypothetical protein